MIKTALRRSGLMRFAADQRGQTAIEYALIVMVLAIAIISSVIAMGNSINGMFDGVNDGFDL
jgi:Flp pilus assembly pilin Flp